MKLRPLPLVLILALALLLVASVFLLQEEPQSLSSTDWTKVQEQWARGKVVLLIRHAERCDRSPNPCLNGRKGITVAGSQVSEKLGQDIARHLDLATADIFSSPVKRTVQTAHFLFDEPVQEAPWLRKRCKTEMQRNILAHKRKGRNLVLVTHATCMQHLKDSKGRPLIDKATLDDSGYGIAWFLATDDSPAGLRPLGFLRPQDWQRLR